MGIAKSIKVAMVDKGIRAKELAEKSGLQTHNVYNSLNKDNMTFERASLLADALGCEIVLIDKETGKIY